MATTQERLYDVLMERVRQDRYPSHQLLDRIESLLYTPEQIVTYAEILTDKVDESWYPSHQLIARAQRILGLVAAAHAAVEFQRRIEAAQREEEE
jgi:hypothetical protein